MIFSPEYLSNNLILASQLIGNRVRYITRLMDLEPKDELQMELGSIVLETDNGIRLYIDVDEGMANILIFDASVQTQPISQNIDEFNYKYLIFPERNGQGALTSLLGQPISDIEVISRDNEDYDFYSMCGFRLNFPNGQSLCIGTYLTAFKLPEVCILMPEEVDVNLRYQPITVKTAEYGLVHG